MTEFPALQQDKLTQVEPGVAGARQLPVPEKIFQNSLDLSTIHFSVQCFLSDLNERLHGKPSGRPRCSRKPSY